MDIKIDTVANPPTLYYWKKPENPEEAHTDMQKSTETARDSESTPGSNTKLGGANATAVLLSLIL